jgi:hypothetical protein
LVISRGCVYYTFSEAGTGTTIVISLLLFIDL